MSITPEELAQQVNKVAGVEISNELDLADLTEIGWVQIRPKDAEEFAEHRQAICVPQVFTEGKVIAVLSNSVMVPFSKDDEVSHDEFTRRAVQYYLTDQKEDTPESFWARMDDYRYKKYGKVWLQSHDEEAEAEATKHARARAIERGDEDPNKPRRRRAKKGEAKSGTPKKREKVEPKTKAKTSAQDIVEQTKAKAEAAGKTVLKKAEAAVKIPLSK